MLSVVNVVLFLQHLQTHLKIYEKLSKKRSDKK